MGYRGLASAVLVCVVVSGGVIAAESVHIGSEDPSPAATAAIPLSPSAPSPTSPVPEPVDIPPGIPQTLSVQTASDILIDRAPVDQTLLTVRADGAVKPGDKPGLYVADNVSTLPGTHQGTVIIGGHAKASHDMVFNPLMQLGQDDMQHSQVSLQMPQGQLTYTIEALYLVDKVDLPTQHALADNRPGRVELITCDVEDGNDTFQNLIVVACDASHRGCSAV